METNADRIEIYARWNDVPCTAWRGWQVFGPKEQLVAQGGGIHPDTEHQINFMNVSEPETAECRYGAGTYERHTCPSGKYCLPYR